MTSLTLVMGNLGDQIRTHSGLGVYTVGEAGVFPCLFVPTPEIPAYRNDLGDGSYTAIFDLPVFAGRTPDNLPLIAEHIDPRSPTSVFAAVEKDRTLGGLNVSATAVGVSGLSGEEIAVYNAWGQTVRVEVFVS